MRLDPSGAVLDQRIREPRVVIALMFDVGSIYLTTEQSGQISNVPGSVVHGCVEEVSSISHELHPDEGRSTIGSLSFVITDLAGAVTDLIRDQLFDEDAGLRHHEVRLYTGDTGNFTDGTWRQVAAYIIDDAVEFSEGSYRFQCVDRQREMRKDIFTLAKTRLEATLETSHIVMTVNSTTDFTMLQHTASFTDAPLATVGYLLVKKTGEIIRYTAKTATTFTGLTREVSSVAMRVEVNPADDDDKKPEIEEFPYLELPAPQLAYALLTGTILGTSITLPESWHLGIATTNVDSASFTSIGTDLFDPNNFDSGLVLRFIHRQKVDGKSFIEQQVLAPIGCFLAITPEGKLQLRRMVRALADAATIRTLTDADFISHSSLVHDQSALVNEVDLSWNYDGDGFTRLEHFVNASSISTHGTASVRELEMEGMVPTRVTPDLVESVFDRITDRYGAPPLRLSGQLSSIHNDLEVGDCVRIVLTNVRDYAGVSSLDRAFEVQQISVNWITGDVEAQFFASAARTEPDAPPDALAALADSWYSSSGTNLTSVLTIVGGVVTTNGSITGGTDLRTSVFYFGGNLTINAGVTVTITGNVQLRILGALTINGTITGLGGGIAAVSDPNTLNNPLVAGFGENVQTVGATRGSDGIWFIVSEHLTFSSRPWTGLESMPRFSLQGNEGGALEGIPAELRGTQGAWGMGVLAGSAMTVRALGGAGGAGGAGLMLVLRGALSFGVSGTINLSGANGAAPGSSVSVGGKLLVAGGGGGGAPGCLLIALDRRNLTYPDLTNKFIANHGSTTQSGSPIMRAPPDNPAEPWTGSSPGISTASHFGACHQIQYLPIRFSPLGEGSTEVVPVPTIVAVTGNDYGIEVQIESIPEAEYDVVEVWGSADNNRANATKLATGRGTQLRVPLSALQTFYLWLRARHGARRSEWSSAADDGYQTSGGPPVLWVDYWVDHFESYETLEDFEKEWEFQQTPTSLSFPRVGINGGKVLQVVGPMRARYRRNIPYNRNALYECEARVRRTVASSGNEQMSIGFWGATPDGTIINGAGGITTFVPNRTLLSAFDMGTLTIDSWQRAMNWFTGSTSTTLTFQTQTPFADTLAPWRPFTLKPRADISPEVPLAYVRPSIECNQVAGSAATCQIDYISVRKISNDFAHADIADSSFSSAIDYEFWTAPSFSWDATLAVASETNGGNSLKFDVAGTVANNTIAARHRHVFRLSDTVKLTFRYRFANVSSLGSQVRFGFYLLGVAHSGEMPRRYVDLGGTPPSVDVLCNTLTTGGGLATLSLSLTSMFSNSYLSGADYIRPVVYVSLPESSDSFDLHVVRAQLTRT